MSKLEIFQFPCLSDNYGVLIHDAAKNVKIGRASCRERVLMPV